MNVSSRWIWTIGIALFFGIALFCSTALVYPGTTAENATTVDWRTLVQLNYQTGEYPQTLGQLHGTTVQVPGFAVSLEVEENKIAEFVLVPQSGMCIHVPPPPPNQMVFVKMKESVDSEKLWGRPVWITGKLHIVHTESEYGASSFSIAEATVRPYTFRK